MANMCTPRSAVNSMRSAHALLYFASLSCRVLHRFSTCWHILSVSLCVCLSLSGRVSLFSCSCARSGRPSYGSSSRASQRTLRLSFPQSSPTCSQTTASSRCPFPSTTTITSPSGYRSPAATASFSTRCASFLPTAATTSPTSAGSWYAPMPHVLCPAPAPPLLCLLCLLTCAVRVCCLLYPPGVQ